MTFTNKLVKIKHYSWTEIAAIVEDGGDDLIRR